MGNKFLFGPIPSRRFGMSLGIDLVPFKTCTIDCVYCECGATTCLTTERKSYFAVDDILREIDDNLPKYDKKQIDYITLTGSGEPTLNSDISRIITHLKSHYPQYKLAILTNGTLLYDMQVRRELYDLDVVKISIDAVSESAFKAINRPCPNLNLEQTIHGIIDFANEFHNQIWLEIFIIDGINNSETETAKMCDILQKITAEVIHINSLDRLGAADWVRPADYESLVRFRNALIAANIKSDIQIIKKNTSISNNGKIVSGRIVSKEELTEQIMDIIRRRPSSLDDLTSTFKSDIIPEILANLVEQNKLVLVKREPQGRDLYKALSDD